MQTDKQTTKPEPHQDDCQCTYCIPIIDDPTLTDSRTVASMTQEKWDSLTDQQREAIRDYSGISPQLRGLEGYRVEVVTDYDEKRRFIVGRSTGWRPCSLEIHNRRCMGGPSAEKHYKSVRTLYKAR